MTPRAQKWLAILAALAGLGLFVAANLHFLAVAVGSQPACKTVATAQAAKPAC